MRGDILFALNNMQNEADSDSTLFFTILTAASKAQWSIELMHFLATSLEMSTACRKYKTATPLY